MSSEELRPDGGSPSAAEPAAAEQGASRPAVPDEERARRIAEAKARAQAIAAARAAAQPAAPAEGSRSEAAAKMAKVAAAAAAKGVSASAGAKAEPSAEVSRRHLLRWLMWGSIVAWFAEAGGGALAMFWPNRVEGFGGVVQAGDISDFGEVNGGPWKIGEAHAYIVHPPEGLMALYWRCVHLGCTVPWVESERKFHCPCHGSVYTYTGERIAGPAPRALDYFTLKVQQGKVLIDTSQIHQRLHYDPSQATKV